MTNTTTLTLADRPAKIGSSINTRTEKHGDDDVPACDIPLTGIMLEASELDVLLGKGAHKAFFRDGKGLVEPRFELLKAFAVREKFLGDVKLDQPQIDLVLDDDNVTLTGIRLEPQVGGLTMLSCQVQCTPAVDEIAQLIDSLNGEIRVALTFGGRKKPKAKKQTELPMGSHTQEPSEDPQDASATLGAEAAGNGGAAGGTEVSPDVTH